MLKGWKTYIVAALGIILNGAVAMGYIPEIYVPTINSILGFLGIAALRAGVAGK